MSQVRIDIRQVDQAADKLDRIDARRLGLVARDVVNEVVVRVEKQAAAGEIADINLSAAYVRSKTDLALATSTTSPRAVITTKGDLTVLGNFGPLSRVVAPGAQRRAGPIKGWRSAGVRIAIRRSQYLTEGQWFLLPLTNTGKYGVFVRSTRLPPSGRAKREGRYGKHHIYGPSPYQLFSHQIGVQAESWEADLGSTAVARLAANIEEGLQ
jgi:hypothetical protein